MNETQQQLIRDSFSQVAPIADTAASLFYGRLFELDPGLRPLFKGDMTEQGRKLMAMIATAVANVGHLDRIVPAVQALGARHAAYGVRDEHYATVGAALLWTLQTALGDGFTPALREAWAECYGVLSGVMREAARQAA